MTKSVAQRAAEKAKRKERDEQRYKIAAAAAELEEELDKMISSKAKELGVGFGDIQSRFLLYTAARTNESKLTVWNGLIHIKSKEWADKKDPAGLLAEYPGRGFIGYGVERIHNDNLYNLDEMSKEDKEFYVEAARQSRAAKINAGAAKTSTDRLVQGSAKNEVAAMVQRLDYLHWATSVEYLMFVVKGNPQDGLIRMYHSTPKAERFFESHLALPIGHFAELMEGSVLGSAAGTVNSHRTPTQVAKTECRQVFLKSLRVAATSVGEDGSAPVITDPLQIPMVEYKNYPKIIRQYKHYGTKLRVYTRLLNDPKSDYGFRRITNTEWEEWCMKYNKDVATGVLMTGARKTQSDAGKKRKRAMPNTVNALEMAQSMANTKQKAKDRQAKEIEYIKAY